MIRFKYEEYIEIEEIISKLINRDVAYLIVKELKFIDNCVICQICNKKKHKKHMKDVEYLCSPLCEYCGTCINYSKICYDCAITNDL